MTDQQPPNLLAEAVAWYGAGCLPVPVAADGTKRPGVKTWRQWQDQRPELGAIVDLFTRTDTDGIGLICGAASGHLEMVELEGRAVDEGWLERIRQAFDDHGQRALWDTVEDGYQETSPSGGVHWLYRVQGGPAAGNTKLARRVATEAELAHNPGDRIKVMVETRGQGGFVVIAPSYGRTHPTGRPWRLDHGGPATIPTLTVDQREALHAIAGTLDEADQFRPQPADPWATGSASTAPQQHAETPPPAPDSDDARPGDTFNDRTSWEQILEPHGWRKVGRPRAGRQEWVRPGKKAADGISATTGGAADGGDRLYVFSTSTPFESERPYTKFGAFAVLNHNGNHADAARALRQAGHGGANRPDDGPALTMLHGGQPAGPASPAGTQTATVGALAIRTRVDGQDLPRITAATLTDQGNADLLAERWQDRLRYVPANRQWLRWDETRWRPCADQGEAVQASIDTIRAIDPAGDSDTAKHKTKSLSRRGLEACATLASAHPALRVDAGQLDADPWILNTPDGTVDLRTGEATPHNPDQLCTKVTRCHPDPARQAPRWSTFLEDTFGGDPGLIGFVRRLAGYSATGAVRHHVLPFLFGPGGNGKSVFLDVLVALLGDYATTAPNGFLLAGGREDESAIARLAGFRLVAGSEVNQNSRFDEAKVKLLTGGDRLTARHLYGRHFTFTPTHTLWLMGNHQPRVEAGGAAFWRRLRLVPFLNEVTEEKRVEGLAELLVDQEGPAIMAWILQGALEVQRDGLREPDQVLAATARYAEEEDALARFVADRLHLGGGDLARVPTAEMRAAYLSWCKSEGGPDLSQQMFGRELRARWNIDTTRSHGRRYYTNVTLLADDDEPATGYDPDDPRNTPWDQR